MMDARVYRRYCAGAWFAAAALAAYPLYRGIRVFGQAMKNGAIPIEEYPKYVIPYTPLAAALLVGVLLLPLLGRLCGRWDLPVGAGISSAVFFLLERIMETKILVETVDLVPLESWQMSLCYVPPERYVTRTWAAEDVLFGEYSPAFKLHFYLISVVILVTLLGCFYGFGRMIRTGDFARRRALIVQAAATAAFIGMCVWACFTAFYRTGELTVSPLSAVLMAVFFLLLGIVVGVFVGSFLLGKTRAVSVRIPAASAVLTVLVMYIGEMILLHGNLYRFGEGVFFSGLGALVLAPADIAVLLASGALTAWICRMLQPAAQTVKKEAE